MQVWIPKDSKGNHRMGMVIEVSVKQSPQEGLICGRDQAKVRYQDGNGGMAEAWFNFDKLERVKSANEMKEEEVELAKEKALLEEAKKDRDDASFIDPDTVKPASDEVKDTDSKLREELVKQAGIQDNKGTSNIMKGVATESAKHDESSFLG